jgi:hypothetical protein
VAPCARALHTLRQVAHHHGLVVVAHRPVLGTHRLFDRARQPAHEGRERFILAARRRRIDEVDLPLKVVGRKDLRRTFADGLEQRRVSRRRQVQGR